MQLLIILVSNALLGLVGYLLNTSGASATTITIISILISLFFITEGFFFYKVRKRHLLLLPALSILAYIIDSYFLIYLLKYNVLGIFQRLLYGGVHIYSLSSMPLFYSDNYIFLRIIINNIFLFTPWLLILLGVTLGKKVNKEKYLRHLEEKNYKPLSNVSRIVLTFLPLFLFISSWLILIFAYPFFEESHTAYNLCLFAANLIIFTLLIQPVYIPILNRSVIGKKQTRILSVSALFSMEFISLLLLFAEHNFYYFLTIIIGVALVRTILFAITYLIIFLTQRPKQAEDLWKNGTMNDYNN